MKKSILFALVMLFGVSLAEAGVVRTSAHAVKKAPKVSAKVVSKTARLAWKIVY
jgi:hypothetical protein